MTDDERAFLTAYDAALAGADKISGLRRVRDEWEKRGVPASIKRASVALLILHRDRVLAGRQIYPINFDALDGNPPTQGV